jgi:hypothetical protein
LVHIKKYIYIQDYGFKFNANNWDVRVINIHYFNEHRVENAPKILDEGLRGYDYYTYSCNTCIKLKTFLEKNPQWSQNIDEWMIPIIEDKKSAKYDGHNTNIRIASIRLPNDKSVQIKMPDDLIESNFLNWVNSEAEKITIQYLDTAASRLQCKAVYGDSLINTKEEGTWRFEGKETLELLGNNKNYEGNKLVAISNNEIEWQTDLTVEQGFVLFKGIRTTKFAKQ